MKKHFVTLFTALLLATVGLFWAGCKSSPTGPGPGPGGGGTNQFITINTPFGRMTLPAFGTSNLKGYLMTFLNQDTPAALGVFFGNTTDSLVYAGNVSVNGNVLDTLSIASFVLYYNRNPLTNVNFDGSVHSWVVSGSTRIPAFTGSVTSPSGVPTITSPADSAIVSRSQSLTVTWTGTGSDTVYIAIRDTNDNELVAIATGTSYTFTAQQMGTLSAGSASIGVVRLKHSIASAGTANFMILSATGHSIEVILN